MPHRDNEGQKRDKMVAISIQDQILGSSILRCFLEITGKGAERGGRVEMWPANCHISLVQKREEEEMGWNEKKKRKKDYWPLCFE